MDEQTFSGSLLLSGVALPNCFTKSSRFEEGFNDNELLWPFSKSIQWVLLLSVFAQQVFVTRKGVKRNNYAPKFYAIPRYVAALLKKPVV